jgi:hypothetical protein
LDLRRLVALRGAAEAVNATAGESRGPSHLGHFVIFTVAFVLLVIAVLVLQAPETLRGQLIDPDSFTRLLRVGTLVDTGRWFDVLEPRLNAPAGLASHWTRPLEVLLILLALPLVPFVGWHSGLYWAGFAVSPLLAWVTFPVFARAADPIAGKALRPVVMVALLAQPAFLNYALPGRVDHHMLLLLLFIVLLGSGVRLVAAPESRRLGRGVGLMVGLGLWISIEFAVVAAVVTSTLGVLWLWEGRPWAQTGARVFGVASATVAGAVLLERGVGSLALEYDRVSLVHVGLMGAVALFFAFATRLKVDAGPSHRAAAVVYIGLPLALITSWIFPGLLADPMRSGDPRVWARYYDRIEELQPLRPSILGWRTVAGYLGAALIAAPFILSRAGVGGPRARGWLLIAIAFVPYLFLGQGQLRFMPFVGVLAAFGIVGILSAAYGRLQERPEGLRRSGLRAIVAATLLSGPLLISAMFPGPVPHTPRPGVDTSDVAAVDSVRTAPQPHLVDAPCSVPAIAHFLKERLASAVEAPIVLANPDVGPELAYRGGVRVTAAPYHRGDAGIRTALALTEPPPDAKELLLEQGVDLILLCPRLDDGLLSGGRAATGLYDVLLRGEDPDWLNAVPLPTGLGGFRLYEVRR